MTDTAFTWGCEKWADCSCCPGMEKCGCGAGCGCGTVTIGEVENAIATQCDKADCKCGMSCRCGKGNCNCGGSVLKTKAQWVEFTKNLKQATTLSCQCEKNVDGTCKCTPTCTCAAQPVPASA